MYGHEKKVKTNCVKAKKVVISVSNVDIYFYIQFC